LREVPPKVHPTPSATGLVVFGPSSLFSARASRFTFSTSKCSRILGRPSSPQSDQAGRPRASFSAVLALNSSAKACFSTINSSRSCRAAPTSSHPSADSSSRPSRSSSTISLHLPLVSRVLIVPFGCSSAGRSKPFNPASMGAPTPARGFFNTGGARSIPFLFSNSLGEGKEGRGGFFFSLPPNPEI
jgi:hypothetical protein